MVVINEQACIGCAACVNDCLPKNLSVKNGKAQIVSETCMNCGHCVAICPLNAVSLSDHDMGDVMELSEQTISPEHFLTFVKSRRSIRRFQDRSVDPALISHMLEAARFTPSGGNRQDLSYVVVQKEMELFRSLVINHLAEMAAPMLAAEDTTPVMRNYAERWMAIAERYRENPQDNDLVFFRAPAIVLVVGHNAISVGAGMASSNIELMAHASGLGALYSGFITYGAAAPAVKELLDIPARQNVLMAILVGHPDVNYKRSVPRKPVKVLWR